MKFYHDLCQRLSGIYEAGEASAIVRLVLEKRFGMSLADVLCDPRLSPDGQAELLTLMSRLESGEPVQYVLGEADFCGRSFVVAPGVLIPRPETEELCRWVLESFADDVAGAVLDVGTGSGCIAITLQKALSQTQVLAVDVSESALAIARENGRRLQADVRFEQMDILAPLAPSLVPQTFSIVVSNPPYITDSERATMLGHVLDHEPHLALFVPDDDPLLFYRAIARKAAVLLASGGRLFFEINPLFVDELLQMLADEGFRQTATRRDQFGKIRFTMSVR